MDAKEYVTRRTWRDRRTEAYAAEDGDCVCHFGDDGLTPVWVSGEFEAGDTPSLACDFKHGVVVSARGARSVGIETAEL